MNAFLSIIVFVLTTFLLSCTEKPTFKTLSHTDAIDSFIVDSLDDAYNLSCMSILNDSKLIAYSYMTKNVSYFSKNASGYKLSKMIAVPDTGFSHAFFLSSHSKIPHFIGIDDKYLYSLEDTIFRKKLRLDLNLKHLKNDYCFFHSNANPVLMDDTSIIAAVSQKSPFVFLQKVKESPLTEFILNKDTIIRVNHLFHHPASIKNHIEPHGIYCINGSKISLLFPCIDSVYEYDRQSKAYRTYPIDNPLFEAPAYYDYNRWTEADYKTKLRLNAFTYQGIFFNTATKHYVLYFVPPVNKKIKVPSYKDQELYAIVLDEQYKKINTVFFRDSYPSTNCFVPTKKGIAMPLANKDYNNEKIYKYYIFDL